MNLFPFGYPSVDLAMAVITPGSRASRHLSMLCRSGIISRMDLIKCPGCGKRIAPAFKFCPACGKRTRIPVLKIVGVSIAALLIGTALVMFATADKLIFNEWLQLASIIVSFGLVILGVSVVCF
jgi:hypothetical protein